MKYTFFNGNICEQIKENFNMNKEEFYIKQEILKLIKLCIVNRKQFFYFIYLNDNYIDEIMKEIIEFFYIKGIDYENELTSLDIYLNEGIIKKYFNKIYLNKYDFQSLSNLRIIDFTTILIYNIKPLCNDIFLNLKQLKICNNQNVVNLYELKNAKFIDLEELWLENDNITDLYEIEMDKYPFKNLSVLKLGYNRITETRPILNFRNLKQLFLEHNNIYNDGAKILLELNCTISIRDNNVAGPSIGIMG